MTENKHNTERRQPSPIVEQLQARVAYLEARLVKAGEEEAALAAHAERLAELVQASINGIEWYRDQYADDFGAADEEHLTQCERALEEKPETSLARRDLIKQAEALDEAKRNLPGGRSAAWHALGRMADELRRQAEEKNNGN
ncbi:hypothetical protein HOP60_09955 [Halomonas daqingensis]|uniref:Tubulin-specific chaperone A n=1 Tax=Billgrantia desiderata TaxID=52021 RepID=A0ABS9B526_9GAMM|nr:hypothetical protein [Halomonas desiderata]MCE8042477.1 hypothetical protein [Halomonas desiderata]MCE8047052.1 hypothetical protein [Halomonas desiderata]